MTEPTTNYQPKLDYRVQADMGARQLHRSLETKGSFECNRVGGRRLFRTKEECIERHIERKHISCVECAKAQRWTRLALEKQDKENRAALVERLAEQKTPVKVQLVRPVEPEGAAPFEKLDHLDFDVKAHFVWYYQPCPTTDIKPKATKHYCVKCQHPRRNAYLIDGVCRACLKAPGRYGPVEPRVNHKASGRFLKRKILKATCPEHVEGLESWERVMERTGKTFIALVAEVGPMVERSLDNHQAKKALARCGVKEQAV